MRQQMKVTSFSHIRSTIYMQISKRMDFVFGKVADIIFAIAPLLLRIFRTGHYVKEHG